MKIRELWRLPHIIARQISYYKLLFNIYIIVRLNKGRTNVTVIGLTEHLGDIVACLPVAQEIKQRHPDGKVIWVVNRRYADLISCVEEIDHLIKVNCFIAWTKFCARPSDAEIIDLHLENRFCAVCNRFHHKPIANLEINSENYYFYGSLLESFCKHACIPIPQVRQPHLKLPVNHRAAELKSITGEKYIVVHTKSNELSRDWPFEQWSELVKTLRTELGFPVVEVGTSSTNLSTLPGVVSLTNKGLTLPESADVISRASAFIGIDSGPAHIANATMVPSIIVLGKYRAFSNYMPYTGFFTNPRNALIIKSPLPLSELKYSSIADQVLEFLKGSLK